MFKKRRPYRLDDDNFGLQSYYRDRMKNRIRINRILAALLAIAAYVVTAIANNIGPFNFTDEPPAPRTSQQPNTPQP